MGGDWVIWVLAAATAWLLFALACRALLRSPRRGSIDAGLYFWAAVLYARLFHRLRTEGLENIPRAGPIIIVANHTGGIDPLLLQTVMPRREIRWMMAQDMMIPLLRPLWEWMRIIAVVRAGPRQGSTRGGDAASAREALRHLKAGGVLGVFPEGGIERPPRRLRPFAPGVGLLALHTGAPVLPVVITGTPYSSSAWGSFLRPSRSRLRVLPSVIYLSRTMTPEQVAKDLERRFAAATGWAVAPPDPEADAAVSSPPPAVS